MSLTINMGGGGGASITVVGGSTQPASASEKTIWVNTSTTITSYVFSYTEPSTPVNGMVWIKTGSSSPVEFNALNGSNVLMVYPTQCKQYVSGAWDGKTAKSYLNGAWQDWGIWLFQAGTGQVVSWTSYIYPASVASVSIDTTKITLSSPQDGYSERAAYVTSDVDFTDINNVYFDIECPSGTLTSVFCGVTSDSTINYNQPTGTLGNPTQSSRYVMAVDVSGFSGPGKAIIWAKLTGEERIYNVWIA